jgi:hypothetical protein
VSDPALLYRNNATGCTVEAIVYLRDETNVGFVRHFLEARAQSVWPGPRTDMGGGRYETICFHYAPGSTLYVSPGQVVYVYTDTLEPSVMSAETFNQYFTKEPAPETPKEPPVTRPTIEDLTFDVDPSTEFGEHVEEVLDALAILRESTSPTHIDIATRDIMGLLTAAYTRGWSKGVEHAQVNPYINWGE